MGSANRTGWTSGWQHGETWPFNTLLSVQTTVSDTRIHRISELFHRYTRNEQAHSATLHQTGNASVSLLLQQKVKLRWLTCCYCHHYHLEQHYFPNSMEASAGDNVNRALCNAELRTSNHRKGGHSSVKKLHARWETD
jgi:hypothetical protein